MYEAATMCKGKRAADVLHDAYGVAYLQTALLREHIAQGLFTGMLKQQVWQPRFHLLCDETNDARMIERRERSAFRAQKPTPLSIMLIRRAQSFANQRRVQLVMPDREEVSIHAVGNQVGDGEIVNARSGLRFGKRRVS